MKPCYLSTALLVALGPFSGTASAEYFGLLNGRSADLDTLPDTSVEVGFVTGDLVIGDFGREDYQHIGGRLNYRLRPHLMLLADIGQSEYDGDDGVTYGIGAYYQTEGVFTTTDFTVKGSFHLGSIDVSGTDDDADVEGISVEGLFSGREPIGESQVRWYANLGLHRIKAEFRNDNESSTEVGFGGGVFTDTANGQLYGGADIIDELTFGVGYRHFVQ